MQKAVKSHRASLNICPVQISPQGQGPIAVPALSCLAATNWPLQMTPLEPTQTKALSRPKKGPRLPSALADSSASSPECVTPCEPDESQNRRAHLLEVQVLDAIVRSWLEGCLWSQPRVYQKLEFTYQPGFPACFEADKEFPCHPALWTILLITHN